MKVIYDGQIFGMQQFGGISRLFVELFKQFDQAQMLEWDVALDFSHNAHIRDFEKTGHRLTQYHNFLWGVDFKGKGRLYSALRKLISMEGERERTRRALREADLDLFHPTYYDDYFLPELGDCPLIVTVYDMVDELFPEYSTNSETVERKARIVKKAQRIIAISESTKADLVRIAGVDQEKIDVIPLATSMQQKVVTHQRLRKPQKYVLYVGQRDGYKNFTRFLRAMSRLLLADTSLYLMCIGGRIVHGGFTNRENQLISQEGVSNQVSLTSAQDHELAEWYSGALCFVFPSLYEGFGIPILEAFSCGCPVVVSNTSSLPEVAGNGAVYFDPKSINSIREAIGSVIKSKDRQRHLVEKGKEKVKQFSWHLNATQTLGVYNKALAAKKS